MPRANYRLLPSVYCACGANWHGEYTLSPAINEHRRRAASGESLPRRPKCAIISETEFFKMFPGRGDYLARVVGRDRS